MSRKSLVVIQVEENPELTLENLCEACNVSQKFIYELMEYGIIESDLPHFTADHLRRVRTIKRLQEDLEVNLAGAALVLDLMDEIEHMRTRLEWLEKYFNG